MTDPFVHFDGAYVLGALPEAERDAFEEHLLTCAQCRARVAEVAGVAEALHQIAPAELDGLAAPSVPMPDTVLPRLLRAAQRERGRRRTVAAVAAVALASAAALVVAFWPPSSSAQQHPGRAMHAVIANAPVSAEAATPSRNGTTMSHSGAGPRWGRISTSPHRKPATRPPMWPPIEMPGMAKVSTRLMISSPPRLVRMIGILRITIQV